MDSVWNRVRPGRLTALVAAVMISGAGAIRLARGADPTPTPAVTGTLNIAIANLLNIANNIKEYGDLNSETDLDAKSYQSTLQDKKNKLDQLQQSLNYLKPDSPQYTEASQNLLEEEIKVKAWDEETKLELARKYKMRLRSLFQEIEDAVASVAQKDGYNLVLCDQRLQIPDNLDNIDVPTLRNLILQRTVLYSDQSRSIDGEVITLLDKNYADRAAGGGLDQPTTAPSNP
ncbi:MAG TPA: OmpH family outer membrane protein [Tepidisphaeraceae bacterium]|nr:OmpH family outer membrane protein [Tepidisphaeraceae bacterium]